MAIGVTGTVDIGNSNTTSITLDGTTYKTDGATEFDATATGASIKLTGVSPTMTMAAGHTLKFTTADVELSGTTGASPDGNNYIHRPWRSYFCWRYHC